MSVINNPLLLGQEGSAGYQISRSLRFNSADSAYLSRTPASAGNRKTWTWAGWVKRSAIRQTEQFLFLCSTGNTGTTTTWLFFNASDKLLFVISGIACLTTTQVFRDSSAWYHIVISVDTTQATASNRYKLYVNGNQITTLDVANYVPQNTETEINTVNGHRIGRDLGSSQVYLDSYLADIHFIDGQALTPSSFGEFDTNGIWQPKRYSGTYGTNGFKLDFADNSSNTATTLGKDTSGNGNNWTPFNLSVTAGAGNDSLVDVPTNGVQPDTGVGGEVRGNYATFNPIAVSSQTIATLANGNLDIAASSGSAYFGALSTFALSTGKWYFEYTNTTNGSTNGTGIIDVTQIRSANPSNYGFAETSNSRVRSGSVVAGNSVVLVSGLSTLTNGDVIGVAVDFDAGKLWFSRNGTWELSGNPASGTNATTTFTTGVTYYLFAQGYGTWAGTLNTGARSFAYTAPSGFKALCTANLPAPVVTKPSSVFDVKLYTGNGSTQTISGLGFSPDFVWLKARSGAFIHGLFDAVRGTGKGLTSNTTDAETTYAAVTSFNSDGFTNGVDFNASSTTYVAWTWDAGSSTVTNTAGSITSNVRANASAGFSIVTYTGTGANATVGHGLGVAPSLVICKSRSNTVGNWGVWHTALLGTEYLLLNTTGAKATLAAAWNSTVPTSTVFSVGTDVGVNNNGGLQLAYCFAPVAGYSAFGSYTGNGSADGPFVFCGFRPRWILVKNTVGTNNWQLFDTARNEYNVADKYLQPNTSSAESSSSVLDIVSNGFKIRDSLSNWNGSTNQIVYAAFAESPFQYARAR
jgi:hypothetical protein